MRCNNRCNNSCNNSCNNGNCGQNNCFRNRCYGNGGNFQNSNNPFEQMQPKDHHSTNQCDVFTALSTTPQTVTGDKVTPLTFTNILYQYGNSIQATTGASCLYITKPGLYQISYTIAATNTKTKTDAEDPEPGPEPKPETATFTSYVLQKQTQVAKATATIAEGGTGILSDTELFYVSCKDFPLTLSLNVTSTAATSSYVFNITINKICSCGNEYCGYDFGPGNAPCFAQNNFDFPPSCGCRFENLTSGLSEGIIDGTIV